MSALTLACALALAGPPERGDDGRFLPEGEPRSAALAVVVFQASMFENYDYRYDVQYKAATRIARTTLEAATKEPGNEGWERFMLAGVVGIEAIHAVRQGRYLPALTLAFEAIDHMESSRAAAPEFVDLALADGMYNYWRTIITRRSKLLPDFGDRREEGIEQMREVEKAGIFLAAPATLSLAFAHYEDGDFRSAVQACARNKRKYPGNVINLMMLGATHLKTRSFDDALANFDAIVEVDANNHRVHYYRALAMMRSGRRAEADVVLRAYLEQDHLVDYQVAWAHYRLGELAMGREEWDEAETQFRAAIRADGLKHARDKLDDLKRRRREKEAASDP